MDKQKPLVSILMGAYNRQDFIAFAIESVMKSTYTNWELIIVDDRSSDDTYSIAQSYARQDSRIKVFLNEKNLGDYPNRNKAAGYATGKYLKYIDSDDAIYSWGLQAQVEMMEQFPEAAYGLDDLAQDDEKMYPFLINSHEAYLKYYSRKLGLFDKAPTSSIIKRDVFIEVGGFRELRMVGDVEMWHRLSLKYSVVAMPQGIIWSRGHAGSESGLLKKNAVIVYQYQMIKRTFLENPLCPLTEEENAHYLHMIVKSVSRIILKAVLKFDFKTYRQLRAVDQIPLRKLASSVF